MLNKTPIEVADEVMADKDMTDKQKADVLRGIVREMWPQYERALTLLEKMTSQHGGGRS